MPYAERLNTVHTKANGTLGRTTTADIDAMVSELKNHDRVVLHFHGGLVDEKHGFMTAKRLWTTYHDAGAYPIFFVWRSGLGEIVSGNFLDIVRSTIGEAAGEDIFQRLLSWLTRYAVGKVVQDPTQRAIGTISPPSEHDAALELVRRDANEVPYAELPVADVAELTDEEEADFRAQLEADQDIAAALAAIANARFPEVADTGERAIGVPTRASAQTLMPPEVVDELTEGVPAEGERGLLSAAKLALKAGKTLKRVVDRFRSDNDHGLYVTVVEELLREFYVANVGGSIWKAMKDETADTFAAAAGEVRAGRYFLDQLEELLATGARPDITLVGHSTGAVFINNILGEVSRRRQTDPAGPFGTFTFANVAFLAPACTFADFAGVVAEHDDLFERFQMFTMTDEAEQADWLVSRVYPRSLLYFVSGVLERDANGKSAWTPIAGQQRYYADAYAALPGVGAVRAFVEEAGAQRVIWSPDPGGGAGAVSHSDFDEDEQVLQSVSRLIAG